MEFGAPDEWHPLKGLPLTPGIPFAEFVTGIINHRPAFLTGMFKSDYA